MYYAIIQEGHGVFGVGESKAEAITSARRLGTPDQIWKALIPQDSAAHGDIIMVACTPELFHHVNVCGFESEIEYSEDGVADIERVPKTYMVELEQYA